MIRTGFVKEKKGYELSVCFERPSSCAGCKGCAKGLVGKNELLTVFGEAEVGDIVDVQMPEGHVFQASLLAYALPLCMMILFLAAGSALGLNDTVAFLMALAGLAAGYGMGRLAEKKLRGNKAWRPQIVQVHKCTACTAEERNMKNE